MARLTVLLAKESTSVPSPDQGGLNNNNNSNNSNCPFLSTYHGSSSVLNGLFTVSAYLSYCNRIPPTGWLINNKNLLLTVLEAGKSKIKMLADSASGESSVPDSETEPHMVEGARK